MTAAPLEHAPPAPIRGEETPSSAVAVQLGELLTRIRTRTGLSRRAMAHRLGMAPNTVRELELGLANPSLRRLERIGEAYGVRVEVRLIPAGTAPEE